VVEMKRINSRERIMNLLEAYEDRDFFNERADRLANSRLSIRDELIV
jgi:hypothetical protein